MENKKLFYRIGTESVEGLWYNNKGEHICKLNSNQTNLTEIRERINKNL